MPVYWIQYGPSNFLWFSDLALFGIAAAMWLENRLIASMTALSVLVLEVLWNVELVMRLLIGDAPLDLTVYMWDESIPLGVRLLSLFHVPLPPLLIWLVHILGYDRRALLAQTALAWIVLPLSYPLAHAGNNINWVLGLGTPPQRRLPPLAHVALLMILFPIVVYAPTHWLLNRLFGQRDNESN